MKSFWTQKLALPLALVCAIAQSAIGLPLVAGALSLGALASDHAHAVALLSDGNHLDLVLSHGDGDAHDHGEAPPGHDHPASFSHSDHVVHITGADATNATPRRAILDPAPVLSIACALPVVAALASVPRSLLEPRGCGTDPLRTVVLRL